MAGGKGGRRWGGGGLLGSQTPSASPHPPPILITAALKHTQPSVSAALRRAEAALCVSLTPVLHPQHPPERLGSQSEPVSMEGYLVWGPLPRQRAPLSGPPPGMKAVQPFRARSPGAAGMPRRGVPAADAPLSSDPPSCRRARRKRKFLAPAFKVKVGNATTTRFGSRDLT